MQIELQHVCGPDDRDSLRIRLAGRRRVEGNAGEATTAVHFACVTLVSTTLHRFLSRSVHTLFNTRLRVSNERTNPTLPTLGGSLKNKSKISTRSSIVPHHRCRTQRRIGDFFHVVIRSANYTRGYSKRFIYIFSIIKHGTDRSILQCPREYSAGRACKNRKTALVLLSGAEN